MKGLILLNKPAGLTSRSCVNSLNKITGCKKIGHIGTLDPGATGMLPLCVGEATKFARFLVEQDKCYTVTIKFGVQTSTGDVLGEVINRSDKVDFLLADVLRVLSEFEGEIQQKVPLVSAVKVNGRRLYEYARLGEKVDLPSRMVMIKSIELLEKLGDGLILRVVCGKGTYIRSLAEDIAAKLGTLAFVMTLHRDWVKPFDRYSMIALSDLSERFDDSHILSLSEVFSHYPKLNLSKEQRISLLQGVGIDWSEESRKDCWWALYGELGEFFGIGKLKQQRLSSLRLSSF